MSHLMRVIYRQHTYHTCLDRYTCRTIAYLPSANRCISCTYPSYNLDTNYFIIHLVFYTLYILPAQRTQHSYLSVYAHSFYKLHRLDKILSCTKYTPLRCICCTHLLSIAYTYQPRACNLLRIPSIVAFLLNLVYSLGSLLFLRSCTINKFFHQVRWHSLGHIIHMFQDRTHNFDNTDLDT